MKGMGKVLLCILAGILAAIFGMSGYRIWEIMHERKTAEHAYEKLDMFIRFPETAGGTASGAGLPEGDGAGQNTDRADARQAVSFPEVDFNSLGSINRGIVGWIYDEFSVINYPIAQAGDNEYYLDHMFDGQTNPDGCIFLDCRNRSDFSDSHCIIYGHYMKSGAMFAALANYKSQAYFEEHPRMLLMTPDGNYTVELFAGYVADIQDDAWVTAFASEADYEAWIAESISKSLIVSDVRPSASDHILTLSTCSYEFPDARFVLLGVLKAQ